jgi:hypothetical protein
METAVLVDQVAVAVVSQVVVAHQAVQEIHLLHLHHRVTMVVEL